MDTKGLAKSKDNVSTVATRNTSTDDNIKVGKNIVQYDVRRWSPKQWMKPILNRSESLPKSMRSLVHKSLKPFGNYTEWQFHDKVTNLLTDAGRDLMHNATLQASSQPAGGQYIALTQNTGAPADGDTALTGELTGSGVARALAAYSHSAGASTSTLIKTFTNSTGSAIAAIVKSGTFNASSGGTLHFENTFTTVTLQANDQLQVTWTITIND